MLLKFRLKIQQKSRTAEQRVDKSNLFSEQFDFCKTFKTATDFAQYF